MVSIAEEIHEFVKNLKIPHPVTKGEINIVFDSEINNDEISVIMYNVSCKIGYSNIVNNTFGEYQITRLDNIEEGIYLLKVSNNT